MAGGASKGCGSPAASFRISTVNANYGLCRTYPALLVVPANVSDESLRRVARGYRHGRLPVVTWRHGRTRALLLRGAAFHVKGVMNMLRSSGNSAAAGISPSALFLPFHFLSWSRLGWLRLD